MQPQLLDLVDRVRSLTGASAPGLLKADAPVLTDTGEDSFYVIGLIGGKEVGKSALVNALIGQKITEETGFGPGTETVVAYAHRANESALRLRLDTQAPGQYRLVLHDIEALRQQVLFDLPDIDSRWEKHLQLTRRMLRQMLFPLWITSVEKYADRQPQDMLRAVAEGNSPENFLFCLNKTDQLQPEQGRELQADFAGRIARLLSIEAPKVWLVSAHQPDAFDLPALRQRLSRQKTGQVIDTSRRLAQQQQRLTIVQWADGQNLPRQIQRLDRMLTTARQDLSDRLGVPLIESTLPAILQDPGHRMALVNAVLDKRLARWPIVNILNTLLSPLMLLVQKNIGPGAAPRALCAAYLDINGRPLASVLQGTFARLQQTQPDLAELYHDRKLWEASEADRASQQLVDQLAEAVARQRQAVGEYFHRPWRALLAPGRWLLTLGALLWFPIVQPILAAMLQKNLVYTSRDMLLLVVQTLSVTYLLKHALFFVIYFLSLWMLLRWHTHRQVGWLLRSWRQRQSADSPTNLVHRVLSWLDDLLEPIETQRARSGEVIEQIETLRKSA